MVTPAERTAREVAECYHTPSLVNHCARSFRWAAIEGERQGLTFDRELLYVAAMLHDLGLAEAFDNVATPFETAGGDVAWVFGAGAGWPPERRERVKEVIVRHMGAVAPDPVEDPESHLLFLATGFDISGEEAERWPQDVRAAVLAKHPRLDLAAEFTAAITGQAQRKPGCAAQGSVERGIVAKIAANPLDS